MVLFYISISDWENHKYPLIKEVAIAFFMSLIAIDNSDDQTTLETSVGRVLFLIDHTPISTPLIFFSAICIFLLFKDFPVTTGEHFFYYNKYKGEKDIMNLSMYFDSFSELHESVDISFFANRGKASSYDILLFDYNITVEADLRGIKTEEPFVFASNGNFTFLEKAENSSNILLPTFKLNSTFDNLLINLIISGSFDNDFNGIYFQWKSKSCPMHFCVVALQLLFPILTYYLTKQYYKNQSPSEQFTQLIAISTGVCSIFASFPFNIFPTTNHLVPNLQQILICFLIVLVRFFISSQLYLEIDKTQTLDFLKLLRVLGFYIFYLISNIFAIFAGDEAESAHKSEIIITAMNILYVIYSIALVSKVFVKIKAPSNRVKILCFTQLLNAFVCVTKQNYKHTQNVLKFPVHNALTVGAFHFLMTCFILVFYRVDTINPGFQSVGQDDGNDNSIMVPTE